MEYIIRTIHNKGNLIPSTTKIRINEQIKSKKSNQIIIRVDSDYSFKISLDSEETRNMWVDAFQRLISDTFNGLTGSEVYTEDKTQINLQVDAIV